MLPVILQFQNVRCAAGPMHDRGLEAAAFALDAGDLLLMRVGAGQRRTPVADVAQGVLAPEAGTVAFLDEDWQGVLPDRAAALRGRIGRVFGTGGWLSNLDVDENITLAQRYHTDRAEEEILEEARQLGRAFGFEELPAARPHTLERDVLRRAQWVRAFLGQPRLLLFEHPTQELDGHWVEPLVARMQAARQGGAAVVWITADPVEWNFSGMNATLKFEWKDTKMVAVT